MKSLKMVVWFVTFAALQGATITALMMVREQGMMGGMMGMKNNWFFTFLILFLWGMFTMKSLKHCCNSMMDCGTGACGPMDMDMKAKKK